MDDWQETAFANKHVHNRVSKAGKSSKKGGGKFNVRNAFGSYDVECRAYTRAVRDSAPAKASLDIFGLTEDGEGLHGTLGMPGVLRATVILAASRKSMARVIASIAEGALDDGVEEDDEDETDGDNTASADSPATSSDREDSQPSRPAETFEKNSFRSPKFWLKWQGDVTAQGTTTSETNDGYIVFAPDVSKFTGTISCQALEWKNVSMAGRKLKTMSERDQELVWRLS